MSICRAFDRQLSGVYIARNFGDLVYDTLLPLDHELQPRPRMVERDQIGGDKLATSSAS
jgi:hypothetical protein